MAAPNGSVARTTHGPTTTPDKLVGLPGREGFPDMTVKSDGLTELPATEFAGFLWVALDPDAPFSTSPRIWDRWPTSSIRGASGDGPRWAKRCSTARSTGNSRSTPSRRTPTSPPCTARPLPPSPAATARFSIRTDPHHRLIFPLNAILELDSVPEDQWDPFHNMVVIYALFPNIVLSVTIANGELFRIYPGDQPGRSITVHQNSTPLDLSDESVAAGALAVFDYAHATVRDEDYRLGRGPAGQPAVRRPRATGVRAQRAGTAASPHHLGAGAYRGAVS